ncbi:MAG TPA: glycosyltransferase, partial [Candidatus Brocadiia bacterium]|nr:glycosyltransferase [Candidatus Brocadiia bacterium]
PRLDGRDLVTAYHAAAAFVFPSLYEGFGFPLIEAVSCGVPAAASNSSSLPEAGGDAPFYFDPTDGDAMLAALDAAVGVARDASRIREGMEWARRRTWDAVAEEYMQVYRGVCGA